MPHSMNDEAKSETGTRTSAKQKRRKVKETGNVRLSWRRTSADLAPGAPAERQRGGFVTKTARGGRLRWPRASPHVEAEDSGERALKQFHPKITTQVLVPFFLTRK